MIVRAKRGKDRYIVEDAGRFYLADLMTGEATLATPPDSPDMFLKAGYWTDPGTVDEKTMTEIQEALQHTKPTAH